MFKFLFVDINYLDLCTGRYDGSSVAGISTDYSVVVFAGIEYNRVLTDGLIKINSWIKKILICYNKI